MRLRKFYKKCKGNYINYSSHYAQWLPK